MRKQDFLIELVKSLSPSESRYFKLYGSIQPGEKKYLDLYDELEKGINTTSALCDALKITPTNLGVLKHYLYQMLMRCLRNYKEYVSPSAVIYNGMEDARLLLGRRMLIHALDTAEKTLTKAWEFEVFTVIDDLLTIKCQCLYNLHRLNEAEGITAEYRKSVDVQNELNEMLWLTNRAMKLETTGNKKEGFKKLCQHPLLKKKPAQLKSISAQIRWFEIMFLAQLTENNTKALAIARQEYGHYQKHKRVKQMNAVAYVVNLTRIASAEAEIGNVKEALLFSDKASIALTDPLLEMTKGRRDSIMAYNKFFKVYVLLQMQDFEKTEAESQLIEELMNTRPDVEKYSFTFYYAVALLHLQKHKPALEKIEELIQIKTDVRIDLQASARVLQIMAQYDLENYQLIPYLVKSAKAWLKRNKQVYPEFDLFFTTILLASKSLLPDRQKGLQRLAILVKEGKLNDLDRSIYLKPWLVKKQSAQNGKNLAK